MPSGIAIVDALAGPTQEPEAVRAHLETILASGEFTGSPRLAKFLTFVVETALAGDGEQIKESLIAVEVYGRRPDYNPQIDSTVRVEAGRLRARLRQYYDANGGGEAVRIELPTGTYAPVFHRLETVVPPAPESQRVEVSPGPKSRLGLTRAATAACLIAAIGVGVYSFVGSPNGRADGVNSVAVLPFVSLSAHPSTEHFDDGLTEELTTRLAGIAGLRVAARSAMLPYRNKTVDRNRLGREHGADALLEGSVRKEGDRLVVTTQLIDARNGHQLWAERYERDAGDSAAVRNEIAARIVQGLGGIVRNDAMRRRGEKDVDPKTMELYHRAQELLRIPVLKNGAPESLPASVVEAVRLFEEVTVRSPDFARGWAGLAEAAEWEYELRGNQPAERIATAKAAAHRAIEVKPGLTEAWTILTSILLYREWNFPEAAKASRRAIELDPRNVIARQRYIEVLRAQGRMAEARFELDRAIELQPAAAAFRVSKATLLYESGNCDEATRVATAAAELTNQMPLYPMTLWVQGLCFEQRRQFAEAEKAFRAGLAYQPHNPWNEPALGHLLGASGRRAEAEAILTELRRQLVRGKMTHVAMALVYTALGNNNDALASLERAWVERDDSILSIATDPRLRPLRSDARFQTLVARLAAGRS
ncbi:MAG: tetratricopeptide repeat protein [Bryobacteraceae bacterium]